jgi:hypothetical protein
MFIILLFLNISLLTSHPQISKENKLSKILAGTAGYCEELKKKVLHFFCEEKIVESYEQIFFYPLESRDLKNFLEGNKLASSDPDFNPGSKMDRIYENISKGQMASKYRSKKRQQKNSFLHEYQIVKLDEKIEEKRNLIQINGKNVFKENPGLQTILYSFKNTLAPIFLFSGKNQLYYRYKLVKKARVFDRDAYVIAVRSNKKDRKKPDAVKGSGKLVEAWIDPEDYSILKLRVFHEAFRGYDYLINTDNPKKFDIKLNDVHYFGFRKGSLRFPSKTEINLSYIEKPPQKTSGAKYGAVLLTNLSTVYTYQNYTFFKIKVGEPIFKKII